MSTFFRDWIDLFALIAAFVLTFILTVVTSRKSNQPLRKGVLFAMLFGPTTIFVALCCHEANVLYDTGVRISEKTFVYNYRFYSLMLMGLLLAWLSFRLLQQTLACYAYQTADRAACLKTVAVIILVSAPTIPLTPIGALPTLCCLIFLIASLFVVKKRKAIRVNIQPEPEDAFSVLERATI